MRCPAPPCQTPPLPLRARGVRSRPVVRTLRSGDTAAALALLRPRPLQNVFLEHVVRAGGIGALPGFLGYERGERLEAILLVAGGGATALEVAHPDAFEPLAQAAAELPVRPLHIVGAEEVTAPFWEAYRSRADDLVWTRREPFYVLSRLAGPARGDGGPLPRLARAGERDLDELVENSGQQYREDLKVDRQAEDPAAFRERHRLEILDGRWWVKRERGRIAFQVHVGAQNDCAVQIGGVFTPPDLRGRGRATAAVRAIAERLLRRHPAVSLFCDEKNEVARRVYERAGFRPLFHFRSWMLRARARGR